MSLRRQAVRGVAWSAAEKWGTQVIAFFVLLVLARILAPTAFGLVAMAAVFTNFVRMFLDQGLTEAIVQRTELESEHLDTAFWSNVIIGVLLTAAGVLLAGPIAALFDEPRLKPIVTCLSLTFLFVALSSTQQAILQRNLDFKSLAIRTLAARLMGGVAGVTAALCGLGVWSLVAQSLTGGAVGVVVLWSVSGWRPRLRFSARHFRELFTFGINMVGVRLLTALDASADGLLIGYFLGSEMLGYYSVAYRLAGTIVGLLVGVASVVLLPMFSRLQQQPERLRHVLYRIMQYVSLLAFPAFLGMIAVSPELMATLYGSQWAASAPVLRFMAAAGLAMTLMRPKSSLIMAMGKPSWILGIRIVTSVIRITAFALAAPFGIVPVSAAFAASTWALSPPYVWMAHRLITLDLKAYFSHFAAPLAGSLAMLAAVLGLSHVLGSLPGRHWQLATYVLAGATVYVLIVIWVNPKLPGEMLALVRDALSQSEAGNGQEQDDTAATSRD